MQFKDQLGFIGQHMKRNKLRVATTILAATMGCAFLIVLASVGFGLHKTLSDDILENRTVTKIEVPGKEDSDSVITPQEAEAMRGIPHVKAVAERSRPQAEGEARLGERSAYADLVFVQYGNEEKAGLALSDGAMPAAEGEVLVGYHFAQSLVTEEEQENAAEGEELDGFAGSLVGQTFEIELKPFEGEGEPVIREFTVAGVTEEPAKDWMMDSSIYADASWSKIIAKSLGTEETPREVLVYADELQYVEGITEKLKKDGYYVYSVTEELGSMNMFFTLLKAGLIFVGTIAILIASIGIFNTMTMAVTERTREIGVMKAIGAQPKLIQRLFLMESAAIGIIGTVLAVIISYGISMLANWLVPMIVMSSLGEEETGDFNILISVIPWQLVAISAAISIGVAMISGWRPARKATQIDVIQALRQEL
ncbi:acetoin utilization transport system permease protein [Planomicrobium koreense]|uniref:Acetoin utilization transport system permease protein n=1 Tax=Planococcus koreensis TaxID=112331 RepID=A0A7W8FW34_9BACL|nr:FtsX-like permease family protein [Planococcus koreensis]MBB5181462.1 acetoin utilization transport system permease protein [Planococcus koreensis]